MTEENTKILYGNIEQNDYYYEWHSEPGACEKCQSMNGKTFEFDWNRNVDLHVH